MAQPQATLRFKSRLKGGERVVVAVQIHAPPGSRNAGCQVKVGGLTTAPFEDFNPIRHGASCRGRFPKMGISNSSSNAQANTADPTPAILGFHALADRRQDDYRTRLDFLARGAKSTVRGALASVGLLGAGVQDQDLQQQLEALVDARLANSRGGRRSSI